MWSFSILRNKQKWWHENKGKCNFLLPVSTLLPAFLQKQPEDPRLERLKAHMLLFFLKWDIQQQDKLSDHEYS